jgi:dipeptidyl aminopeptidase/acylaminoacyl peptidase
MSAASSALALFFTAADRLQHMRGADVRPIWTGPDSFVYKHADAEGTRFVAVDAAANTVVPAFDHAVLAANLTAALGRPVEPNALPFEHFEFTDDRNAIRAGIDGGIWTCGLAPGAPCSAATPNVVDGAPAIPSPDGCWLAYLKGGNLWLRPTGGGDDIALTTDAVPDYGYAGSTGNNCSPVTIAIAGMQMPPNLRWAPDSTKILTHRIDERGVKLATLLQNVPGNGDVRAKAWTYRYSMPDEPKALLEQVLFDVPNARRIALQTAPIALPFVSLIELNYAWWGADSGAAYYVDVAPFKKAMALKAIDAHTGAVRTVVSESAEPSIEPSLVGILPMIKVIGDDVVWYSRRSGTSQLYRYDLATGRLLNAITQGDFTVRDIVHIDQAAGRLFFLASGAADASDAYYNQLYSVRIDGTDQRQLTPEDAEHTVPPQPPVLPDPLQLGPRLSSVSPSGAYLIDTHSRPNRLPVTVLRRADGTVVRELARGELVGLDLPPSAFPEPFEALAADGVTKLYGTLYRPVDFNPAASYPIVDSIYPGPQTRRVRKAFVDSLFDAFFPVGLAQYGMIVFTVDGRGTPDRPTSFVDQSYGQLSNAGMLEDHVAVIHQLAERFPYIDASRAGIYGASGGGYATARAMFAHGETFKAGVSICGNHDQRGYIPIWAESYNGPNNPEGLDAASNTRIAHQLTGKLFLIHGEMDDNVHPALTMQVVDALIKADKDFELLIVPNANHGGVGSPYVMRRTAEFLARELGAVKANNKG